VKLEPVARGIRGKESKGQQSSAQSSSSSRAAGINSQIRTAKRNAATELSKAAHQPEVELQCMQCQMVQSTDPGMQSKKVHERG
jgi:ribosomal protein L44E